MSATGIRLQHDRSPIHPSARQQPTNDAWFVDRKVAWIVATVSGCVYDPRLFAQVGLRVIEIDDFLASQWPGQGHSRRGPRSLVRGSNHR
jgi:hypothetical protein